MTDDRLEKLEEIGAIARMIGWGSADILTYYHSDAAGKLKVREKKKVPSPMPMSRRTSISYKNYGLPLAVWSLVI